MITLSIFRLTQEAISTFKIMTRIRARTIRNEMEYRRMMGMHSEMLGMDSLPAAMDRLLELHGSPGVEENDCLASDEEDEDIPSVIAFGTRAKALPSLSAAARAEPAG